jgi:hypothetical protein
VATKLPRGPFRDETFIAAESLTAVQYHAVLINTSGLAEVGAANERCIGILQNLPDTGEQAVVRTSGQTFAMVDGATDVAINDPLDVDASGHLVKQETDKGWIVGYAREAYTSATPGLIVIDINPQTESV